ncbi:MAG: hypothetical protein ACRD4R_16125 [Candidatus Acidiferrales bacterium]
MKSNSEYMAFRPGDLASKIDVLAQRAGCSKSDILRRGVEMYIAAEPTLPYDCYLGAAWYFSILAKVASELGLFSWSSFTAVMDALRVTEKQVREKLEPLLQSKTAKGMEYMPDDLGYFPDLDQATITLKRLLPRTDPTAGSPISGEMKLNVGEPSLWPIRKSQSDEKRVQQRRKKKAAPSRKR